MFGLEFNSFFQFASVGAAIYFWYQNYELKRYIRMNKVNTEASGNISDGIKENLERNLKESWSENKRLKDIIEIYENDEKYRKAREYFDSYKNKSDQRTVHERLADNKDTIKNRLEEDF